MITGFAASLCNTVLFTLHIPCIDEPHNFIDFGLLPWALCTLYLHI